MAKNSQDSSLILAMVIVGIGIAFMGVFLYLMFSGDLWKIMEGLR